MHTYQGLYVISIAMVGWLLHRVWLWLLSRSPRRRVAVFGLPNAGKSTLAQRLLDGQLRQHEPHMCRTHGGVLERLSCLLTVHPCPRPFAGSGKHARYLERSLHEVAAQCHGVIFVVDSSDREQLGQAAALYDYALRGLTVPRVVVLNKFDLNKLDWSPMTEAEAILRPHEDGPQAPFVLGPGGDQAERSGMRGRRLDLSDDPGVYTVYEGSAAPAG
jgi:GTPase SAR1 family protein